MRILPIFGLVAAVTAFVGVLVVTREESIPASEFGSSSPPVPTGTGGRGDAGRPDPAARAEKPIAASAIVDAFRAEVSAGAGVERVIEMPAGEMARHLAEEIAVMSDESEAREMTNALSVDPEMSRVLAAEASGMRSSADSRTRARGLMIESALGIADEGSRRRAFLAESDAEARSQLLRSFGAPATEESRAFLVDTAARDVDPTVRRAAIELLPAGLAAPELDAVLALVSGDPDPAVRGVAVRYFAGLRSAEPRVLTALLDCARSSAEDRDVRRQALRALRKIEASAPGALAEFGVTEEDFSEILRETGPFPRPM